MSIKENLLKEKLEKEVAVEQVRLKEKFEQVEQKDLPTTINELGKIKSKIITFPNGLKCFVGGTDEKDLENGINFVEDYFASHQNNPSDILIAQEHKEAELIPDREINVEGMRLLYYKSSQNLRNLAGQEIVNLDDITGKEQLSEEVALELLTNRAKDFLATEYEDNEDEEYDN